MDLPWRLDLSRRILSWHDKTNRDRRTLGQHAQILHSSRPPLATLNSISLLIPPFYHNSPRLYSGWAGFPSLFENNFGSLANGLPVIITFMRD